MTKFCSALYLENLLTNIFAKLNLRGGVSCMPAALLLFLRHNNMLCHMEIEYAENVIRRAVGTTPEYKKATRSFTIRQYRDLYTEFVS